MGQTDAKGREILKDNSYRKIRRGGRGKNKSKTSNFGIFGTNCAGLTSKLDSFKSAISTLKPKVFMLQEVKYGAQKTLKLDEYEVFEYKR